MITVTGQEHYQKTLKDGNNMILKLFEPAYYTKEYGIDNDIKRMLHDISDYFALKQYSELINKITISTAIAPKEILSKGLWEESIKCWPKSHDAFVCGRIDFELYDNATVDYKKALLIISILRSIKKLEKKGKLRYTDFEKDMLEFCKINKIKIEKINNS